jgi:hypothetical protein
MVEHMVILTQAQGGFRQNKSTDINSCKLYGLTKEVHRRIQRFLRVDIDFKSAFNSMIQASLWTILEVYNIPDMDFLKSLYEHATVRLPHSDMGSAKITFNTGVAQGSVLSPLLFSLFINALSHYLDDIDTSKRISHGVQGILPFNHILFVDDMSLLAQNSDDMQCLLNEVQEFEAWSGIPVNTTKTKLMVVDVIAANRTLPVRISYKNIPLDITPETEAVCYLGFWATPNGNMQAAMQLVMDRTLRAKETIQDHPLGPKQEVQIFVAKVVGNFRYLATAPWKRRDLDRLDRYWRQGYKTVWKLNESVTDQPWTTPKNMVGMGYTTTLAIITHTLHAHVDRLMNRKDVANCIMENDLQRVIKEWLYTSKDELTTEAAARTWDDTVDNVWHRLVICDHLLDLKSWKAGNPHPDSGLSYASTTRHLRILRCRLEEVMGKTVRFIVPPCPDISKERWDLLWSGEITLKKYGETLWIAGHKVVDLYHNLSETEVPRLMLSGETCKQTYTVKVPHTPHLPEAARKLLESYLRLADWNHLLRMGEGITKTFNWATSPEIIEW